MSAHDKPWILSVRLLVLLVARREVDFSAQDVVNYTREVGLPDPGLSNVYPILKELVNEGFIEFVDERPAIHGRPKKMYRKMSAVIEETERLLAPLRTITKHFTRGE